MDTKNIRIIDIARLAEVSPGTVDRVLHNRGKVAKDKQERIEAAIKELNYEPNLLARSLASKKKYAIGVLIPQFISGEYWEKVSQGVGQGAKEFAQFNLAVNYFFFNQYDSQSFKKTSKKLLDKQLDGVVISTLFGNEVIELSKQLDSLDIPYIYIDANITGQNNLSYFGVDSYASGKLVARLLLTETSKDSDIIIANYHSLKVKPSTQIQNREAGFRAYLEAAGYSGKIHYLNYTNREIDNIKILHETIKSSSLVGCVVFNSRIYELIELTEKENIDIHNIRFAGYDTIEKNVEALQNGKLSFLISQNSEMQGYTAIKTLSNYLLSHKTPEKVNYMSIDILVKENIDFYKK